MHWPNTTVERKYTEPARNEKDHEDSRSITGARDQDDASTRPSSAIDQRAEKAEENRGRVSHVKKRRKARPFQGAGLSGGGVHTDRFRKDAAHRARTEARALDVPAPILVHQLDF